MKGKLQEKSHLPLSIKLEAPVDFNSGCCKTVFVRNHRVYRGGIGGGHLKCYQSHAEGKPVGPEEKPDILYFCTPCP